MLNKNLKKERYTDIFELLKNLIPQDSPFYNIYINTYKKISKYKNLSNLSPDEVLTFHEKIKNSLISLINGIEDTHPTYNPTLSNNPTNQNPRITIINQGYGKITEFRTAIYTFEEELNKYKSLIFIDLDDFSLLNKNYGIIIGNEILKTIKEIIAQNAPYSSLIAYTERDEFIIAFNSISTQWPSSEDECRALSKKILKHIRKTKWYKYHQDLFVTATISFSIRRIEKKEINTKKEREVYEDINYWILRTIEGNKIGKKNGKNRISTSPTILNKYIVQSIHKNTFTYLDSWS